MWSQLFALIRLILGARTVATSHATLHDNDLLALPRVKHWHTGNGRARLERDWVHGVVCADDERDVGLVEVIVDLVHLQHDYTENQLRP